MKKKIIIFCAALIVLSITAFGFINRNDLETDQAETKKSNTITSVEQVAEIVNNPSFPDFFYDIGTRFNEIKKVKLDNARSFNDFIGEEHAQRIVSYKSLSVIILDDNKQTDIRETGTGDVLTPAQIKLLQSSNYSTNILIRAEYIEKNKETGKLEESYWTPYLTIVPEKQAEYMPGKEALIEYLKNYSRMETALVQEKKIKPGKIYFTVSKKGTISNVKLTATSGYSSIDELLMGLIIDVPGKWEPAENSKGEKVDQELVISFGNMGC